VHPAGERLGHQTLLGRGVPVPGRGQQGDRSLYSLAENLLGRISALRDVFHLGAN
jgi:hypothetical protein